MADSKITALTSIGTSTDPANDPLVLVDVSDTSMAATGTTKKVTLNNLLACSPTATLASATITGDLTVDASTLKVDSANNRVGIGTASPGFPLDIIGASGLGIRIYESSTGNNNRLQITQEGTETRFNSTFTTGSAFYTWQIAGSTAMTLNSTGLAIGDTAFAGTRLTLRESATVPNALAMTNRNATQTWRLSVDVSAVDDKILGFYDSTSTTFRMQLTDTGNLGIGVTPSAWGSGYKVIQGQIGGFALSNDNSSNNQFRLSSNAYFDTTDSRWEYFGPSTATAYEQRAGEHRFFNAISGSANTAIAFTQAMTLDASGRLILLASTTTPATLATNGELTFTATSNTNLRFSYRGSDGVTRVANITLA